MPRRAFSPSHAAIHSGPAYPAPDSVVQQRSRATSLSDAPVRVQSWPRAVSPDPDEHPERAMAAQIANHPQGKALRMVIE